MKFSPEGDSFWSRHEPTPSPVASPNPFFRGTEVLSSGNIVTGGTAQEGNKYYIRLVKAAPGGCLDTLVCGLVPIRELLASQRASIYPNLAREFVSVELPSAAREGVAVLYDGKGMPVKRRALPGGGGVTTMETGGLPPGIFFLEIQLANGRSERRKLLILH
jgi:hypothetical protein